MSTLYAKPRTDQKWVEERILCDASSRLLDRIYEELTETKSEFFTKRLVKATRQAFRDYHQAMLAALKTGSES